MNFRVLVLVFVFSFLVINAQAQAKLMSNGTSVSTVSQPPAPSNSIAIIDSGLFADDKTGIARVSSALTQVNAKFGPIQRDIKGMQDRLVALRSDIQKKQGTAAPNQIAQQTEQADQLELQIKRKAEDAQADYQKQIAAVTEPLQADISNALNAYAQAHGILIIIDVNRVPLIYANDSIDITKDFIADYNRTHPAGAAAPTRP